jgi:hypothetical protein
VTIGTAEDAAALQGTRPSLLVLSEREREGVWLCADGLKVAISWRGLETDPRMLDAARDAILTVAAWHRPATPYR